MEYIKPIFIHFNRCGAGFDSYSFFADKPGDIEPSMQMFKQMLNRKYKGYTFIAMAQHITLVGSTLILYYLLYLNLKQKDIKLDS